MGNSDVKLSGSKSVINATSLKGNVAAGVLVQKPEPQHIDVVRVGRTTYRLRNSADWKFLEATNNAPGQFEVKGFEDIVVGVGPSMEPARRNWIYRLHSQFQQLYLKQNTEPLQPPEHVIWEKLSQLIDIEAYRKSVSIVSREIGKVVRTCIDRKLIKWESGTLERVRYTRAPAELVTLTDGEWLQAMVARHPDTYKFRRILWLKAHTPWSGELDDEARAKLDQIPTIASLPKTTWE